MSEQATIEGVDVLDAAPPLITTAVAEYTELCAGLNEMQKLRGVAYDLTTVKGNDQARKDRKKLVTSRTWLDARRIELNRSDRASIAERIALRDTEAARLEGLIRELERPISEQLAADEHRREQERIAKLRAEEERMSALRTRINDIGNVAVRAVGLPSVEIESKIALVTRIEIDASFEELEAAAGNTKFETLLRLRELHTAALASEAAALEALRTKERLEQLEREDAERRVREAAAKAAADAKAQAEAEAARVVAAVRQRQSATANELVDEIRRVQRRAFSASAAGMLELVGLIEAIVIGDELGDFAGVAMKARDDALADLHEMHGTVLQRETDKRAADAEAARVRDELDAARAGADRLEQIAEADRAALAAVAQPVEAPVVAVNHPIPWPLEPELVLAAEPAYSAPNTSVGDMGRRLGFLITQAFIEQTLKVMHSGRPRGRPLWKHEEWLLICDALVKRVQEAAKWPDEEEEAI